MIITTVYNTDGFSQASPNGSCPFSCPYKTNGYYCQFTCCRNPEHNGSGIHIINKELLEKRKMEEDPDYGR